jgi:hypothetical protein
MRISSIISFALIAGVIFAWGALLKLGFDGFALWNRGQTAVVLPIENYETTPVYKKGTQEVVKNYYVANLSARLPSGDVVSIPRKPVSLEQIQQSQRSQMSIVFLPGDPQTNHFVGEEPKLLRVLLMAVAFSIASFVWFRRGRA